MPGVNNLPEIKAPHLDGSYKTYAQKTLRPQDVSSGKNYRQNKDGGRFPRLGYEDCGIDVSSYAFTMGRGFCSAKSPKKLWFAGDNGSNVKIVYVDTDVTSSLYGQVYDVGLTLTTGYYVDMKEWFGDIYYGNGADTNGRIVVGRVATGGVLAGAITLDLKPGNGIKFANSGSGQIGSDTFSWTGKSSDQLTGVTNISSNHVANEVVTVATTISANYCDKASIIFEWLSSLNLLGDPEQPFTWEFSKFANAANLGYFYDFSGSPSNTELVGLGGEITGALTTKNFAFIWKSDGMFGTGRTEVNTTNGARIPQPIKDGYGAVNPRCIVRVGDDDVVFMTPEGRLVRFGAIIQNGSETIGIDTTFDNDVEKRLAAMDPPGADNWLTFNQQEKLLKASIFTNGVREILVKDYNNGNWYDADTNKNFDCVVVHSGKTWAYDGTALKLYIDEQGNYDDTVPVDCDWTTGRLGVEEFDLGKAKYNRMHGYMTLGSIAYVDFYSDDDFQFTTILTDARVTRRTNGTPLGTNGIGMHSTGSGGGSPMAFPFRLPIGMNHKGEDFKIKVRIPGENGDFVQFDGFRLGIKKLRRSSYVHA